MEEEPGTTTARIHVSLLPRILLSSPHAGVQLLLIVCARVRTRCVNSDNELQVYHIGETSLQRLST